MGRRDAGTDGDQGFADWLAPLAAGLLSGFGLLSGGPFDGSGPFDGAAGLAAGPFDGAAGLAAGPGEDPGPTPGFPSVRS